MGFKDIQDELVNDPLARGYAGMTTAQKLASLVETKDRASNKATLTGSEVLNAVDKAEFTALSPEGKKTVWDVAHLGTLNPFGIEAGLFVDVFGGTSETIIALALLRKNPDISRAEELKLGSLSDQIIETAIAGSW